MNVVDLGTYAIEAANDWIVALPVPETETPGGIALPDSHKSDRQLLRIVSAGKWEPDDKTMRLERGDLIVAADRSCIAFTLEGECYAALSKSAVVCRVRRSGAGDEN